MKVVFWLHILVFLSLYGCSGGGSEKEVIPPIEPETPKVRIALNCGIASRATETNFESGDKVGLFVVNYNGSSAGTLQNTGNHADNVKFTYSSKASDFLWGKTGAVSPSSNAVDITLKHVCSCMQIKVAAGKGYMREELNGVYGVDGSDNSRRGAKFCLFGGMYFVERVSGICCEFQFHDGRWYFV